MQKQITRRKPGDRRQLQMPFELAEQRKRILDRIGSLEADIHEQITRVLEGGPERIWAEIGRMKKEKKQWEKKLRGIEKRLP
ncbi:MAG: hypothetical protein PHD95_02155 [Candidatus ainarchaeum sp.]|nr:hypothetical protein [Candidatus ainarchaeum sp.]